MYIDQNIWRRVKFIRWSWLGGELFLVILSLSLFLLTLSYMEINNVD